MKEKAIIDRNGVIYLFKNSSKYMPQLCCRVDRYCSVDCVAFHNIGQIDSASKNGGKEYVINTCENKFYVNNLLDMRELSPNTQGEIIDELKERGEW